MKRYRSLLSVSSASGPSLEPSTEDGDSLEANLVLLTVLGGVFLASSLETLQHRNHKTWIPESSLAVLAGLTLGLIIRLSVVSPPNNLVFNGEIFFLVALPVLIFDAGFSLRKKEFFGQLFTILVFSIVGTAGAAAVIGAILYAAGQAGASLKLVRLFPLGAFLPRPRLLFFYLAAYIHSHLHPYPYFSSPLLLLETTSRTSMRPWRMEGCCQPRMPWQLPQCYGALAAWTPT